MPSQSRAAGAIALIIAQAIVLLLGWITHPIIGRVLGRGPYGVYGVVLSIQTIMGIFLTLGIPVAISRFVAQRFNYAQSILRQGLRWQITVAIIITALTVILAEPLSRVLNDPSLTNLIRLSGLVVLLQAGYPIYVQFLSGMHRFNRQALLTTVYAIAKLIGALILMYFFSVAGAFAGFAVGGIVAAGLGWYWTRHLGGQEYQKLPLQSFLSFAGTYVVILVGLQLLMSLDLFMVKAMLHDDALAGDYNAAVTLSRIPYLLLQGISFVLLPSVSALTKPGTSRDEAATFIQKTLRYLIALIVPAVALASATSRNLIQLFFFHEFTGAAPALTILMVGLGSLAFYLLLINIVAGAGQAKVGLWLTFLLIVISAGLGTILIPRYGLQGAAWQTTIASLIGLAILSLYTFKTFAIPLPYRSTINVSIAAAIAVSITYVWKVTGYALPLLYVAVASIYGSMLIVLGEVTREDRALLARLHPKLQWIARS